MSVCHKLPSEQFIFILYCTYDATFLFCLVLYVAFRFSRRRFLIAAADLGIRLLLLTTLRLLLVGVCPWQRYFNSPNYCAPFRFFSGGGECS